MLLTASAFFILSGGAAAVPDSLKESLALIEKKLMITGDCKSALSEVAPLLKDYPAYPYTYALMGVAHYGMMEYGKSYEYLIRASSEATGDDSILDAKLCLETNRPLLQVIEELNGSLAGAKEPDTEKTKSEMATAHYDVLKELLDTSYFYPALALAHVHWIRDNYETYKDVDTIAGDIYRRAGMREEAEQSYGNAIKRNPSDCSVITRLGDLYWEMGAENSAIRLFEKSVEYGADYPLGHFFLGKAYLCKGMETEGLLELEEFRSMLSGTDIADSGSKECYLYALHKLCAKEAAAKRPDLVARMSEEIVALDPHDQAGQYNLAVWYFNYCGNRRLASAKLNKVIEIDPDSQRAAYAKHFLKTIKKGAKKDFIDDFVFIFNDEQPTKEVE